MAIDTSGLSRAITKHLREFVDDIIEGVDEAAEKNADTAVKELKSTSPRRKVKGGTYARGWRKKKLKTGSYTIHNKHYRLTHLLEKGHAKINGGRVEAIVHIQPVEERTIERFEKEVEEVIRG